MIFERTQASPIQSYFVEKSWRSVCKGMRDLHPNIADLVTLNSSSSPPGNWWSDPPVVECVFVLLFFFST